MSHLFGSPKTYLDDQSAYKFDDFVFFPFLTMFWKLLLLSTAVSAVTSDRLEIAESADLIKALNNANTTWRAGRNFPVGTKRAQIRRLLGLRGRKGKSVLPIRVPEEDGENIEIPESFDAREHWPKCKSIKEIKDQSDCGSCWAVAAASTFSDRLCIASKGRFNECLSALELLSCCTECGDGCQGGYDDQAWLYFKQHGIVTGGDYGSGEGCQPYSLQPCEHHVKGKRIPCPDMGDPPTPDCSMQCTNPSYKIPFKKDHHKTKASYQVKSNVKSIQREMIKHGPVEAGFTVYEDFYSYKSGVYQHVSGGVQGGHAVRVIGWGVESGTPYWLAANSWNTDWGDEGLFKIKRGSDECGFESEISAGIPAA